MANVYEKIQNVKLKLLEANLKKSGQNRFANYTYYELSDFLPTIIKLCNEEKLYTSVSFDKELALLEIVNSEKPEERVIVTSPMEHLELKGCNSIQALGGTETYSRRYLYMAAFDIVENDMFDAVVSENKKITKEQAMSLSNVLAAVIDEKQTMDLLKQYKVTKLEDLNTDQYADILRRINKKEA